MTWASERRLDYIDWRLLVHSSVRRGDLVETFAISMQQASTDLNEFLRTHRDAMEYDPSAKRYVPSDEPYRSRRKLTPTVVRAIETLAAAGHPLGWS